MYSYMTFQQNDSEIKIQQLNNLHIYVEKYRIVKTDNIKNTKMTHTSMGSFLGSFNISDDKIKNFFKLYQRVIKNGYILGILESHLEQGPLIIDLDFKYTLNANTPNTRIYTKQDTENIIKIFNQIIFTYLSVNPDDMYIYILEKPLPKIIGKDNTKNTISYKDGIHIMYPYICANNKVQLYFRELLVNKIKEDKILEYLNLDNSIYDVFDKAVIERNNWLLYGSCKYDNPNDLYKLTKIYDVNLKETDLDEVDWFNLPTLLSIRKFQAEDNNEFVKDMNMEKINILYNEIIGKSPVNSKPYTLNSDIRKAKMLVNMLSGNRVDSYNTWIELGFCLHNIDESLLEIWDDFSKKSGKYKAGECEKHWLKFRYEGLNIGSLYRWAKEDNPEQYSDFLINELDDIIKNSLDNTSYSVAKVFYEFNKYNYICTSIKNKKWYEFKTHRWVPMDEANGIIKKLNTELSDAYIKVSIAYNTKALNIQNDEIKKALITKSKNASNIAQKLHKMAFKREVVSELLHLYSDTKFMEKLDENKYLIGFNNGIYDLKNSYFRNGRPEDYLSMNTNCDYIPYDNNNQKIKEVENFFEQIQQDREMREYLLLKLSSFLEGVQRDQKFEIWTGTGANGKGRILKLLIDSFGEYASTISIALLTKPRGDSNSASPSLANTKGKRCCVFQEPENDDKIHVGHMKNLTGGDKLQARSLYSDPVEFYPQFKTILACNKLPEIPSADGGTWRRLRVVPFETKFVDNPKELHERKKIGNIDDIIDTWRSEFMSILIQNYKTYIKDGIDEPPKVLLYTNQYQNNSDIYMEYIGDNISSGNDNDFITLNEIIDDLKRWCKDSNRTEIKKFKKGEIKIEFEQKMGIADKSGRFYGYTFRTNGEHDANTATMSGINVSETMNNTVSISHSISKKNTCVKNISINTIKSKSNIVLESEEKNLEILDNSLDNLFIHSKSK